MNNYKAQAIGTLIRIFLFSCGGFFTVLFTILKLFNIIDWSWVIVFTPLLLSFGILFGILLLSFLVLILVFGANQIFGGKNKF